MLLFYIFVLKDNRLNTDNNIPYWLMPVFFNQVLHKQLQFYHLSIGREYFLITPINTWIIFLSCNDGTSSTSQLQFYTIILSRLFLKSNDFFCNSIRTIFIRKRWKYSHIPSFLIRVYIIKYLLSFVKNQTVKDNSYEISGNDPNIVRIQIV